MRLRADEGREFVHFQLDEPRGQAPMSYEMRAESPGMFHALLGQAMYVPEIRANGEEIRVIVGE
jgi:hypothetical protein